MSYDAEQLRRGLELAEAPAFLVSLLELEDSETTITTESGLEGRMMIDTFEGKRTATCEATDNGVLHRISVQDDHFLYEQIAIGDGAATLLSERLDFERICEPNPKDPVHEWLELLDL